MPSSGLCGHFGRSRQYHEGERQDVERIAWYAHLAGRSVRRHRALPGGVHRRCCDYGECYTLTMQLNLRNLEKCAVASVYIGAEKSELKN